MAYKHDIFLSYTRGGMIENWLSAYFLRIFKHHLESALGRPPDIFLDREGIRSGDSWPLRLKTALSCSRCLVAIWSPSYFFSEWCVRECVMMLRRESELGYRTDENPTGLVLPVNASDGSGFPEFAQNTQWFDCRDYIIEGRGFEKTEMFVEFQIKVREWSKDVALTISGAPAWSEEWLNEPILRIPDPPNLVFEQPVL